MLDDVEGALWTQQRLDDTRVESLPYVPLVFVVAVDPSVAEHPTDECGIIVCAATTENDLFRRQFYVVEDATVLGSPNVWASAVVAKAREYACPVIAEVNQGGALIRSALQNIDPTIKVLDVRAKYGKLTRAEPVSLAFEQHRGHMVGWHPDLESQLVSLDPLGPEVPGPTGRYGVGCHLAADPPAARPLHRPDPGHEPRLAPDPDAGPVLDRAAPAGSGGASPGALEDGHQGPLGHVHRTPPAL